MAVTIRIPLSLSDWFSGSDEIICRGHTVKTCFDSIRQRYPEFNRHMFDESGKPANVLVFLNGDNIMNLDGLETPVKEGDEIGIIPLAAGG
jgi:sulfur-carrier protein